jgi:hypothetical protein
VYLWRPTLHYFSLGQNRPRPCGMPLGVLTRNVSSYSGRARSREVAWRPYRQQCRSTLDIVSAVRLRSFECDDTTPGPATQSEALTLLQIVPDLNGIEVAHGHVVFLRSYGARSCLT